MRGTHFPTYLKEVFAEHPELRARTENHFALSDWKMSQWIAGTQKPSLDYRVRIMDYIAERIRAKRGDGLA